jgi:hypothetical protein
MDEVKTNSAANFFGRSKRKHSESSNIALHGVVSGGEGSSLKRWCVISDIGSSFGVSPGRMTSDGSQAVRRFRPTRRLEMS